MDLLALGLGLLACVAASGGLYYGASLHWRVAGAWWIVAFLLKTTEALLLRIMLSKTMSSNSTKG